MFMAVGKGRDTAFGTVGGANFDRHKGSVSILTAFWGCFIMFTLMTLQSCFFLSSLYFFISLAYSFHHPHFYIESGS